MSRQRGRPERPLDPDAGPVQRFAHELRSLRVRAGSPSYRTMSGQARVSVAALSRAASGERLPSVAVVRAYAQACGADPDVWLDRLRAAAEEVAACGAAEGESPYQGLARFEPGDQELFFGRDALAEDAVRLMKEHRFAVLLGASGSGKSSLLRAGVMPRLERVVDEAGCSARLRLITPGARPAATHGRLLAPGPDEPHRVVVVDQFEEIFTLCRDRAERWRFVDRLLAAKDADGRLRVVVAVGAGFHGRCVEHPELAEALRHTTLSVGPMTREELRDAVVRPATAAGLRVERELTARIVEEVHDQPGALPMLSHALRETWRRRRSGVLTLAAYEEAGGVHGAIAAAAEEVYAGLSDDQAGTARRLLLALIAPGDGTPDSPRPVRRADLREWPDPEVPVVLERLSRARLITVDEENVELAHAALITRWPRLQQWIEENRERLRMHRHLAEAARNWQEHGSDPGTLYRGVHLALADVLFTRERHEDDLTARERAFLCASRVAHRMERWTAARMQRRIRGLVVALTCVLGGVLVAGQLAWHESDVAEAERTLAAARQAAGLADRDRVTDPRARTLLGIAAWRLAPLPESRAALFDALTDPERDTFTAPHQNATTHTFLTASGRTLLTAGAGTWTTWDVPTHHRTGSGRLPNLPVTAVSPDGRTLALAGAGNERRLWRLPEGAGGSAGSESSARSEGPARSEDAAGPGKSALPEGSARPEGSADTDGFVGVEGSVRTGGSAGTKASAGREGFAWPEASTWGLNLGHAERAAVGGVAGEGGRRPDAGAEASVGRDEFAGAEASVGREDSAQVEAPARPKAPGKYQAAADPGPGVGGYVVNGPEPEAQLRGFTDDPVVLEGAVGGVVVPSADARLVVVCGWEQALLVRDIVRHRTVPGAWQDRSAGECSADSLVFDRAGTRLAAASDNGVRVWDTASGRQLADLDQPGAAHLAFTADGRFLAVAGQDGITVRRVSGVTTPVFRHDLAEGPVTALAWDPGAPTLRYLTGGTVHTLDLSAPLTSPWRDRPLDHEALSPDGRLLATAERHGDSYRFRLRSTRTGRVVAGLPVLGAPGHTEAAAPLMAFSPDSRAFAYGNGTRILVWNATTQRMQAVLQPGGASAVRSIALTPGGRKLLLTRAASTGSRTGEVWSTARGTRTDRPAALTGTLESVLASGFAGPAAALPFGLETDVPLGNADLLALSPDGVHLATGGSFGSVTVWRGRTERHREAVVPAPTSGSPVTALAFSPDGRTLAVGYRSGALRLWDTATRQPLGAGLDTPGDAIRSLAFGAHGDSVYAAGPHVPVQRYAVGTAQVVTRLCARTGRNLTGNEWRTYLPDVPYRRVCDGFGTGAPADPVSRRAPQSNGRSPVRFPAPVGLFTPLTCIDQQIGTPKSGGPPGHHPPLAGVTRCHSHAASPPPPSASSVLAGP